MKEIFFKQNPDGTWGEIKLYCTIGVETEEAMKELEEANELYQKVKSGMAFVQEWVSVKEPPKKDGRYLLLFEDGSMCDAIYEAKRGQFGIYEQYWNAVNGWFKVWTKADPTHWAPLPQPPKEAQE